MYEGEFLTKILTLDHENLTLELAPACGGAIASFRLHRDTETIELMRPASPEALASNDPLLTGCFPLVPFSNRIENGEFSYNGRQVGLSPNMPPHPHPLHGQGWRHPWTVTDQTKNSVILEYRHRAGDDGWPWPYVARQVFELQGNELTVALSIENESDETVPVGLGLHPYFPRTDDPELDISLQTVWETNELCIPIREISVPGKWRFNDNRKLDGIILDHCFSGWSGRASIKWASKNLQLIMSNDGELNHLVIYVPEGEDFFCIEPVSNVTNAINMAARNVANTGHRELAPGKGFAEKVKFQLYEL